MRLIVGLGNPDAKYELTRHNLGFMLIDFLARETNSSVKRKDCRAFLGRAELENETVELVKPQTYMNLSGEAVSCLLAKNDYVSDKQKLIVITDDLALPFGKIRLRPKGSAGGHNGLKSIIAAIKTEDFIRVRIGIQPEHPISSTINFVLERFTKSELDQVEKVLEQAAEAIRAVIRDGIEKSMAKYN